MLSPRVIVARYNPQHSLRLAVALQKANSLTGYYTGLYLSWQHPPFSYLRWLPKSLRSSIDARFFAHALRWEAQTILESAETLDEMAVCPDDRIGTDAHPFGDPGSGM